MTMAKHAPAARTSAMPGLPRIRNGAAPAPATAAEERREAFAESTQDFQDAMAQARADDKFLDVVGSADFVTDQVPTQIWGLKAVNDPPYKFSRWYFRDKVLLDLFLTQEAYDAAEVEQRRALARGRGFRYAALGPMHSREPHKDAKLRAQYPSAREQLAQKGA